MYTIEQINEVKKYEADAMAMIMNSLTGAEVKEPEEEGLVDENLREEAEVEAREEGIEEE